MATTNWESLKSDPLILQLKNDTDKVDRLTKKANIDSSCFSVLKDMDWPERVLNRTSALYTIMVIGQVSSGKSSFINSLLGRKLLLPADRPTDGVVSVLMAVEEGQQEYAEKILQDGTIEHFNSLDEAMRFLRQQDTAIEAQLQCREVRLYLNESWLKQLRIVNTPGLGDRLEAFETVTRRYLQEDESELIVWTFFPETAANVEEVKMFGEILAERRSSVVGVVTRCLEGREDDLNYEPQSDSSLVGSGGVVALLREHLGKYLSDILLYDSHQARRLVAMRRENPAACTGQDFVRQLERCGQLELQKTFDRILGQQRDRLREAKIISILQRCGGYAEELALVADACDKYFAKKAGFKKEEINAWKVVETKIIGPAKSSLKDEIRTVASERSKELVNIMGNAAADCIGENFKLIGTLGRSLFSWTTFCDSAAESLNKKINAAVQENISRQQFNENLGKTAERLINDAFIKLQHELEDIIESSVFNSNPNVKVDAGRPAGGTGDFLGNALGAAIKAAVSELLKSLATKLEEKMAEEAVKKAAGKAVGKVIEKTAVNAGKQGASKVIVATGAKALGIITLVLIPFDVMKMIDDFKKGRDNLMIQVHARYTADRTIYEMRIFEAIWAMADDALNDIFRKVKGIRGDSKSSHDEFVRLSQNSIETKNSLQDLAEKFKVRVNE